MVENPVADPLLQLAVLPELFFCKSGKTHCGHIPIQLLQFLCELRRLEREVFFASERGLAPHQSVRQESGHCHDHSRFSHTGQQTQALNQVTTPSTT